jgi:hypothetical protein
VREIIEMVLQEHLSNIAQRQHARKETVIAWAPKDTALANSKFKKE